MGGAWLRDRTSAFPAGSVSVIFAVQGTGEVELGVNVPHMEKKTLSATSASCIHGDQVMKTRLRDYKVS